MQSPARRVVLLLVVATGCSAARVVNEWRDPEYVAPHVNRILIVAVSRQASIRRAFEDRFVAELRAAGVDAVPSYRYIPEDGPVVEARLQEAVTQANADAALITRLVRVERKTEVSPGYYEPAPALTFGFYRTYTAAWLGYYEPPRIYQRDVYISETSLYDLRRNRLVWSGTVKTDATGDIDKAIKHYVKTVVKALEREKVLTAA
jgi:hypothetical protein